MKKLIALVLALSLVLAFAACAAEQPEENTEAEGALLGSGAPQLLSVRLTVSPDMDTVSKDEKFGSALLSLSQEKFEALGFALGDGCSVEFGNGFTLPDVPYFNGYYVRNGEPVIVAYPGDPCVRITLNNMGIWDAAGLSEGDYNSAGAGEVQRHPRGPGPALFL